jgi:lactate racemase
MASWVRIEIPFGEDHLLITAPSDTDILSIRDLPAVSEPAAVVETALLRPIGSPSLREIILHKGTPAQIVVAIAVSDATRPLPYAGKTGILLPLLRHLADCGIRREHVRIIVATGMHRPSTREEKERLYGTWVVEHYAIEDHDCEKRPGLVAIGTTRSGTPVWVNSTFFHADLRICTGMVESHFMAGFSGGRKSVCPGLADKETVQKFHGPDFLESPRADNLILDGNPCHEEALEVAAKAGVDFIVNVTVDRNFQTTGVYAGDMVQAHLAACRDIARLVAIPVNHPYDIIITHGGRVGLNHYQTAKAACGALPALKEKGCLIVAANNCDMDPIGSDEYRNLLKLLKTQGPEAYIHTLGSPDWRFMKDQWEPEMWVRVLRKTGDRGLIYCSPNIPTRDYAIIPGLSGYTFLNEPWPETLSKRAELMVQRALTQTHDTYLAQRGREPVVAFLQDGPYGVPVKAQPFEET